MGITASCDNYLTKFDKSISSKSRQCDNEDVIQERNDTKYLGTKYPFGDNEIHMFYTVYNEELVDKYYLSNPVVVVVETNLINNNNNNNQIPEGNNDVDITSYFLHDLHRGCYKYIAMKEINVQQSIDNNILQQQQQQHWANEEEASIAVVERIRLESNERLLMLDIITNQILPINFSTNYFQSVFALHTNNNNNNSNNRNSNSSSIIINSAINNVNTDTNHTTAITNQSKQQRRMDEYTRKAYLESYFRALAISSRRGSRAAIKAMFLSCTNPDSEGTSTSTKSTTTTTTTTDNILDNPEALSKRRVYALELIDMGYRLALASAYMQCDVQPVPDITNCIEISPSTDSLNAAGIAFNKDTAATTGAGDDESNKIIIPNKGGDEEDATAVTATSKTDDDVSIATTTTVSGTQPNPRNRFLPPPLPILSTNVTDTTPFQQQQKKKTNQYFPTLDAFADSLLEKARVRCRRTGIPLPNKDIDDDGTVTLDDVFDWVENVAPLFGTILPSFMYCILFPKTTTKMLLSSSTIATRITPSSNNNSRTTFTMPSVPDGTSEFFTGPNSPLLFKLGCLSAALSTSTPYYRLYTSAVDGLSFNRLLNAILGYSGPTLFLIKAVQKAGEKLQKDSIFGAYTSSPWKESKDFYGNTDSFLFQLSPCTSVYRPTSNSSNFMYCNSAARSRGYDQQAHGIGFGGTVHEPRLFLEEKFENCTASSRDLTFDNGPLLPQPQSDSNIFTGSSSNQSSANQYFDIDTLEVWGVGTIDQINLGLGGRESYRAVTNEAIRRARKVDKAQFLDDFRSGMIDNKAFQHRQQIDGRADVDVDARYHEAKKNLKM